MKTHKELKEEYKQMKSQIGVFQIRNTVSGKVFVGSSTNLKAIWHRTKLQLNFGNHPNQELQQDWKELGETAFVYEIVSEIQQSDDNMNKNYEEEARQLEGMFLEEIQPFGERGYNKRSKF